MKTKAINPNVTLPRIIAIDYGTKRTGLATTDPLKIIATALDTVRSFEAIAFLKKYAEKETIESFVVGMPKKLDNTDTNNTAHVVGFIRQLKKAFPEMNVYEHDERFTSKMAMQAMIMAGTKKADRREKGNIDMVSATIILQSFLESQQ